MASVQINGNVGGLRDANEFIPGTTVPEKVDITSPFQVPEVPPSFSGPTVNGQPTTVTLFSPPQLAKSPLVPSLYRIINNAFGSGDATAKMWRTKHERLRSDHQLFDELGTAPETFTYVISYPGTEQVLATATGKRYVGKVYIVEKDEKTTRETNTWKRFSVVPQGTSAWELSTMAVDPPLQGQGLAKYLMKLVEDEIKRRFKMLAGAINGEEKPTQLRMMITSIKERNYDFYLKKGYTQDYEVQYEPGHLGSIRGFVVVHMSRAVELEEL